MDLFVLNRAYFRYLWDVPILVTPICIVRRSRSLPDDSESTNRVPGLVDVADLNDLTSSKSGASGNSADKQDADAEEDIDQFEDASPLTPVHSPRKKAGSVQSASKKSQSDKSSSGKSSPGGVVPQDNSTRNLTLFTDGVVPVVNVTILRELTTPETKPSFVRKTESQIFNDDHGDFRKRSEIEEKEVAINFTAYDTGPSTSATYRQERRKSVKRQGSLVKEKSIDNEEVANTASAETPFTSSKSVKDVVEGAAKKLTKDRRKNLKEQKSIERVNEYLAKHGAESESSVITERRKSCKEIRPLVTEKTPERRQSLAVDIGLMQTPSERRKSLTKQEHVEIVNETGDNLHQEAPKRPETLITEDAESSTGRRSSMKKKKESPGSFDTDEVRSPGETSGKKEVKIRENVEEILYEDSNELVTTIPEVQLVRAKIISAEEAANLAGSRVQCSTKIELNSPPEIVTVVNDNTDKLMVRNKIRKAALSAEEHDEGLLNLPGLTKSTSENVLVESPEEENTISGKNFRPDILLDLSKMPDESDDVKDKSIDSPKEKRILSRVGSEGSKKIHEKLTRISNSSLIASVVNSTAKDKGVTTTTHNAEHKFTTINATQNNQDLSHPVTSDSGEHSAVKSHESGIVNVSGDNQDAGQTTKIIPGIESKTEPAISITESDRLQEESEEIFVGETIVEIKEKAPEIKPDEPQRVKPEVVTKTLYKSDFPLNKKNECGYKSVNQRLRERDFSGSFSPKLQKPIESSSPTSPSDIPAHQRIHQILTTDKEAEEQRQKALEKQREHEKFLQQKKTVYTDDDIGAAEDNLISKEHSLEYQSQTLEARSEGVCEAAVKSQENINISLEDFIEEEKLPDWDFKEEIQSLEKREAETQTQQETKSTQCGNEDAFQSSLSSLAESPEYFGSPRKEVETQTQGETKGTQCGPDDLAETFSQLKGFFRQKSSVASIQGSPRREVEVQTEQESKSVQCTPDDIPDSPQKYFDHRRKEAEVQTYQESRSTQFSPEEVIPGPPKTSKLKKFPLSPEPAPCASQSSSPIIVLVDGRTDMTVTHNYKDKDGNVVWAKHWGPERMVEIYREPKSSLGLSIVGGKVDLYHGGPNTSQNISGIFIKNVLPNSPAGRTGDLKTGDRIIEVDGVDLRNSTHERAVQAIQAAGNPVCLTVQSLVQLSPDDDRATLPSSRESEDNNGARGVRRQGTRGHGAIAGAPSTSSASFRRKPSAVSPARTITPELIQEGIEDEAKQGSSRSDYKRQSTRHDSDGAGPSSRRSSMKQSLRKKAPSPPKGAGALREVKEEGEEQHQQNKPKYSSDESSDEEDTRDLEGNVYTKAGMEISRKSAGNVKRSKEEAEADPEPEDEFGYTAKKIKKRYDALGHPVVMVRLEKDRRGLGISLAGHKDRNRMAVFVCGLNPKGVAHKTGGLHIGDEILEVNGTVLQGRCHLNASAMIKGMAGTCFKVIVLRRSTAVNDLAVKPIVQFPPTLDEDDPDRFNQYRGVRTVSIKKGQYGLGIMIIEGKHAEVGQGIFVSDIQEGSAAEQAGLQVGDMILAVNLDSLLGSSYDEATGLLKKTEGVVNLTVCNPNQSKLAKEEEERAKGGDPAANGVETAAKEPEKPKEPEPPKDPKDCEISVGRETTIEFPKDKDKGMGLSIAGGTGTPLGGIVIIEVFPEGAAGKDGRLQPGDQIIDMCHESFKAIEYAKAHETILKAVAPIQMIVFRDDKPPEEFDIELPKKSGKGVGLCLTGYKSGKGAYVSDMLPGGSALESGKITKGDRVVAVGGQDMREAPVEDIAIHVKVSNPVQLKLARYKTVKQ